MNCSIQAVCLYHIGKKVDNRMFSRRGRGWGIKRETSKKRFIYNGRKCQDIFANGTLSDREPQLSLLKRNIYLFHDQFGGSHSDWNSLWFKSFQYFLIVKITPKYKKKVNDKIQINMNRHLAQLLKSRKKKNNNNTFKWQWPHVSRYSGLCG